MIEFTTGNLLEADVKAVVNTVNTVGVMGKGIALMFKERYPENYKAYAAASKAGDVKVGELFVTDGVELDGPRWIINFPTKQHWRNPTKREWVEEGLVELRNFITEHDLESIAIPPLGCGNGGLDWKEVRPLIEQTLAGLPNTRVLIYEPTIKYQNVAKKQGVQKLTPARALIAELIRRYWVLGIECTILEVQKLAWFLERSINRHQLTNVLDLQFKADRYGPYAHRLTHLLNGLDGSYLKCDKRLPDAGPMDTISFDESKRGKVDLFLRTEAKEWLGALEETENIIDGFQSPLGLEALATVDWLLSRDMVEPHLETVRAGLDNWSGGKEAGIRKQHLFTDKILTLALERVS